MRTLHFILVIAILIVSSAPARALFDYTETPSHDLSLFPKWLGVLERDSKHRGLMRQECQETSPYCLDQRWQDFLLSLQGQSLDEQLRQVNRYHNQADYILDMVNWGVLDYWATPYEFFNRDGDCEDYAIAKYMSLKQLGVPPEQMRVVVLQDTNLNIIHSVLAVYAEETVYILDNQIEQVITDRDIRHYLPIYSINEGGWWRHLPRNG